LKLEKITKEIANIKRNNNILLFRFIEKYIINVAEKWIEENF
jgi:hypothetical protein